MLRFRQIKTLQKFATFHANVHNYFNLERHRQKDLQDPPLGCRGRVAVACGLRHAGEGESSIEWRRVRIGLTAPSV
jgi:putative transposase